MTDFSALDALYPLPADELFRQWVLTRDGQVIPPSWRRNELEGWHLGAHPDASVHRLCAADGTPLGWILEPQARLGAPGDALPTHDVTLQVAPGASPADVERALYGRDHRGLTCGDGIEGLWVAVVFAGPASGRIRRVYLGAIHSVVYSAERRVVATSHNLIPGLRRDEVLSRAFDPLRTGSYFTLGLTAFASLSRLLPNHYLDLDTFAPRRHWPSGPLEPLGTGEQGAAAIVEHSRRIVQLLAAEYGSLRVFLSAGHDSRAVLAMVRPLAARGAVRVATTGAWELNRLIDLQAARRLARVAGLPHDVSWRRGHLSDTASVMKAFVRLGESKGGPVLSAPGVDRPDPDPSLKVAGMGGETGRAYFWKGRRYSRRELTPELLVARLGSPAIRPVLDAADAWLSGLPAGMAEHVSDVLDLAYVEQRLGCWESTTRYLYPGRPRVSSPMTAAYCIQTMLRLPEEYRAARRLQRDMVAHGWPELLEVPFNTPSGLLRAAEAAVTAAGRARRRLGRLRRRVWTGARSTA